MPTQMVIFSGDIKGIFLGYILTTYISIQIVIFSGDIKGIFLAYILTANI